MINIKNIFDNNPKAFWKNYIEYLGKILKKIDPDEVNFFTKSLIDARESKNTIFVIGNGGSASTASHFANDLSIGTREEKKPLKVISLTDNLSIITAISNDYGYNEVFVKQLRVLASPEDVLIAISASGNSPNLLRAFEYANTAGIKTLYMTAFDGGKLRKIGQGGIHVPTAKGDYGPAEDAHLIINHFLNAYLVHFLHASN